MKTILLIQLMRTHKDRRIRSNSIGGKHSFSIVFSILFSSGLYVYKFIFRNWQQSCSDTSSPARVSAHGGRDPGKPAWPEHFLKLAALIINELSLFGYTNNCACYKCWPNSNSVNMDVICQSEIIVNVSSLSGEAVCFVRSLKKRTIGVFFCDTVALYIFIHRFMIY